jgi:hypothetical protein
VHGEREPAIGDHAARKGAGGPGRNIGLLEVLGDQLHRSRMTKGERVVVADPTEAAAGPVHEPVDRRERAVDGVRSGRVSQRLIEQRQVRLDGRCRAARLFRFHRFRKWFDEIEFRVAAGRHALPTAAARCGIGRHQHREKQ